MTKHRITTILYLIIAILALYMPFHYPLLWIIIATFIYITISVWGSYQIQLQYYVNAFCKSKLKTNKIAITFDDGPDNNTEFIVQLLGKYNAKATFFFIGNKLEDRIATVKMVHQHKHLIGNHSYYHKNTFPVQSPHKISSEIKKTSLALSDIINQDIKYFRPPFGVTNPLVRKALNGLGMVVVGWNIRSLDTAINDKSKVLNRITKNLGGGDIVLLHDTTPDVLWIVEELLKHIDNKGLQAVTIDDLYCEQ